MEELPLNGKRLRSIWWSWFWRSGIVSLIAALAQAAVMGLYKVTGHDPTDGNGVALFVAALVAMVASVIVVQMVMRKNYREFRITLVARETKQP